MSRIGKQSIAVPQEVEVTVEPPVIRFSGPKGSAMLTIPAPVNIHHQNGVILVNVKDPANAKQKALWGTFQRLITNNINGLTRGFTKKLRMQGIGYRAGIQGNKLLLEIGFSHPVILPIPSDITIQVENNNTITVSGIDKQRVGQIAANIRSVKKPEPYKGKGIMYEGEIIRRKAGKQAASGK
jgi:large subunit ribosomal protein L6